MGQSRVRRDWYRRIFGPESMELPWAERTAQQVDRVLEMLRPSGTERILDLACGNGRHSLELTRRGFSVVGVDLSAPLVDCATAAAADEGLDVEFTRSDLRDLDFDAEFDLVISLNDGAIGYFENDRENLRTFEVVSQALRPGGRHLMQVPNVLFARKHSPYRTWMSGSATVEMLEYWWSDKGSHLYGASTAVRYGSMLEPKRPVRFRQRLYTINELDSIFESVGMRRTNVFRGSGKAALPDDTQYEMFVESHKAGTNATVATDG